MKVLIVLIVMLVFSYCAYTYKNRFKLREKLICGTIEYIDFYKNSICFYKDDIQTINSNYNIMQKNKNANNNIFIIKNNVNTINNAFLIKYFNKYEFDIINRFFNNIGSCEIDLEKEKTENLLKFLNELKYKTASDLKEKGEMWFKIIIMLGAIISIIIW